MFLVYLVVSSFLKSLGWMPEPVRNNGWTMFIFIGIITALLYWSWFKNKTWNSLFFKGKSKVKPDYTNLSFADCMGIQLKSEVERQLLKDLKHYGIIQDEYKFDWSDCCIEGHRTNYLDSEVENFSSIMVFNADDELVANGWMEFIHEDDVFIVYWEFLDIYQNGQEMSLKSECGIPLHIYNQLPNQIKLNYKDKLLP